MKIYLMFDSKKKKKKKGITFKTDPHKIPF